MTSSQHIGLPLQHLRVLDFSHAAAGPFATMLLGDLGAEVIKIEKPGRGDGARFMGQPILGEKESEYYLALNRNKRDVLIDLSTVEGRDVARNLAGECDIVVENFRPGVMERLGLGFEDLKKCRPHLIYCSISAWGDSGPWRDRPGNDIIVQSVSGLMGITGERGGDPVRIGASITDYTSGLYAASGILAAVVARETHPEGQHVKVALLDSAMTLMCNYVPLLKSGLVERVERVGLAHPQIVPYQAFECEDGRRLFVGAFTNAFWARLCVAVDRPEWLVDARFATNADRLINRTTLVDQLEEAFRSRTCDEWFDILAAHDVPCSPLYELDEALDSPQAKHNGVVKEMRRENEVAYAARCPIRVKEWGPSPYRMPPRMGEDTVAVLGGLETMSEVRVQELFEKRIIGLDERDAPTDGRQERSSAEARKGARRVGT